MRKLILLFILVLFSCWHSHAQQADSALKENAKGRPVQRNILWFTPTRAQKINGIALGSLPSSMVYKNENLKINGLHADVNPIILFVVPYILIHSLRTPFADVDTVKRYGYTYATPDKSSSTLNGINVGVLGSGEMKNYNGISISSIATFANEVKGISITIGTNRFYNFRGVLLAGLLNDVNKGNGVQIALFNRCKDCKGVQLGLLNKMGKRTTPIINFRF